VTSIRNRFIGTSKARGIDGSSPRRVHHEDLCAEPYYRGLMRAYLALEQPAAALRCFHRCRDLLATLLKVPPSAATLAVVAQIPTV